MTIKELKKILSLYDENTEVKFAQYGTGIIEDTFEVETIGDYTSEEKSYILIL